MNRWITGIGLALLLVMMVTGPVVAHQDDALGGCPDGFDLHDMSIPHEHEGHAHQHVGNDKDQNGDDHLCVKHVGQDGAIHVHIDNNVPK